MHYSAKRVLRSHVVRPSVCDVGGSRSHRLKILHGQLAEHLRSYSPKAIHLLPGEHGEILGRLEVGWGIRCWAWLISPTLCREALIYRAHRAVIFAIAQLSSFYTLIVVFLAGIMWTSSWIRPNKLWGFLPNSLVGCRASSNQLEAADLPTSPLS